MYLQLHKHILRISQQTQPLLLLATTQRHIYIKNNPLNMLIEFHNKRKYKIL
jgi:hypothetical protein